MSGGMAADDTNLCRNVVKTLTSDRYKDKNYLFLLPFDLSQTPGYMDVVEKVMHLSTLSQNLEAFPSFLVSNIGHHGPLLGCVCLMFLVDYFFLPA